LSLSEKNVSSHQFDASCHAVRKERNGDAQDHLMDIDPVTTDSGEERDDDNPRRKE
jgi:hypothetical protein